MSFADEVLKKFLFLVDKHDAECKVISDCCVGYTLGKVAIEIFQDYYSYEIDLKTRYLTEDYAKYHFNLFDIIATAEKRIFTNSVYFQSHTEEGIEQCLSKMVELVQKHFNLVFSPELQFLEQVEKEVHQKAFNTTVGYMLEAKLESADKAWKAEDFNKFIKILEPVEEHLTEGVLKKMSYARKKLGFKR